MLDDEKYEREREEEQMQRLFEIEGVREIKGRCRHGKVRVEWAEGGVSWVRWYEDQELWGWGRGAGEVPEMGPAECYDCCEVNGEM